MITPTRNDYDAVHENSPNFHYLRDLNIGTHIQNMNLIGPRLHTSWFLELWSVPSWQVNRYPGTYERSEQREIITGSLETWPLVGT